MRHDPADSRMGTSRGSCRVDESTASTCTGRTLVRLRPPPPVPPPSCLATGGSCPATDERRTAAAHCIVLWPIHHEAAVICSKTLATVCIYFGLAQSGRIDAAVFSTRLIVFLAVDECVQHQSSVPTSASHDWLPRHSAFKCDEASGAGRSVSAAVKGLRLPSASQGVQPDAPVFGDTLHRRPHGDAAQHREHAPARHV